VSVASLTDYPLSLAAAHGRIAAYREALGVALVALSAAAPYVGRFASDPCIAPAERSEADILLAMIDIGKRLAAAELAVTNP